MDAVHMDGRVFVFAFGLAILSAAIFGLVPSLQVSQLAPHTTLQLGTARATARSVLRQSLVIAEIALSLVLLVGAGLMLRSFAQLQKVETGFDPTNVITAGFPISDKQLPDAEALDAYSPTYPRLYQPPRK